MKNLIILSYSYWPNQNPRAYRWTTIAEELAKRGINVKVITNHLQGHPLREMREGVDIHRVGNFFISALRNTYISNYSLKEKKQNIFSLYLISLIKKIWKLVAWPDTTIIWYRSALNKTKELIKDYESITLVSVTPSFSSALIGNHFVNEKKIKWIIDLGDPFSLASHSRENNFLLYNKINRYVEKRLFNLASGIIFTNLNIKIAYSNLYTELLSDKLHIVAPLSVLEKFDNYVLEFKNDFDHTIKIIYIGSLYRELRTPNFLLDLFHELKKISSSQNIELHFYGHFDECLESFNNYSCELGKTIFLHQYLDHELAFEKIQTASLLVNIGNKNVLQLPSKIADYVLSRKPILNLVVNRSDPSYNLLKEYSLALNLIESEHVKLSTQAKKIIDFIERSKESDKINAGQSSDLEKLFGVNSVVDAYSKILFNDY